MASTPTLDLSITICWARPRHPSSTACSTLTPSPSSLARARDSFLTSSWLCWAFRRRSSIYITYTCKRVRVILAGGCTGEARTCFCIWAVSFLLAPSADPPPLASLLAAALAAGEDTNSSSRFKRSLSSNRESIFSLMLWLSPLSLLRETVRVRHFLAKFTILVSR